MTAAKRPSTSSLRRFINSRPYIALSEIRRRFGLEEDAVTCVTRNGTTAYVGLPEREALKLAELWQRGEIGLEFSVEVRAPAVIGIYPMRMARYVQQSNGNGAASGYRPPQNGAPRAQPAATGPLARRDSAPGSRTPAQQRRPQPAPRQDAGRSVG